MLEVSEMQYAGTNVRCWKHSYDLLCKSCAACAAMKLYISAHDDIIWLSLVIMEHVRVVCVARVTHHFKMYIRLI